ncbi:hypothetical protein PGSY75_0906200 [Plasmodium gaboni]|uniref:Uncharacterized protein n=1 Tax=Plasmodium gaboni TaxID=647221 RepID=A0A151LLD7_9APIC|nr:hypothetical protein PGSY75_0906200 [Plasmodium gaboni]KYO00050.1 hypothetical protein PGSY75_0906200 [Plasmodium gaboni]SOV22429.1 conserved Plasmodium protein, unknown function [Plasmodium sp. DRC-Itaito]
MNLREYIYIFLILYFIPVSKICVAYNVEKNKRNVLSNCRNVLYPHGKGSLFYTRGKYLFIKRKKEDDMKYKKTKLSEANDLLKNRRNDYMYGSILENNKVGLLSGIKEKIGSFIFGGNKNIIEKLKDLNEKKSLWFFTGYARNIFQPNSFYNILAFEEIQEIDYKKWSQENKINFDYILNRKVETGKDDINKSLSVNIYKVKKYVIFYKNEENINNKNTNDNINKNNDSNMEKQNNIIHNNNQNCNNSYHCSEHKNDFILCTYIYLMFYIYDKEKKKSYIFSNNIQNKQNCIYQIIEVDKEQYPNLFHNIIMNPDSLKKHINIIALEKSHSNYENIIHYIGNNELLNINNYTNKFNSYLKKLYNICNNSSTLIENSLTMKNSKPYINLIFSDKNFMIKKKSYFEYIKTFFLKKDDKDYLIEYIFNDNKGYKFYIQKDLGDNSSYVMKSTKITTKKLDKIYKLINNLDSKNINKSEAFFAFTKILFDKYKNEYEIEQKNKSKDHNMLYHNSRSIFINMGSNNYVVDTDLSMLKKNNDILLFSMAKHFFNHLLSCVNI